MPLKIIRRSEVPPGGYRYFQKETSTWIDAPNRHEWIKRIRLHRESNSLVAGNPEEEAEQQLCERMPPGVCEHSSATNGNGFSGGATTLQAIISGTKTLVSWWVKGREKVSQQDANIRAATCINCPFNVPVTGCMGCNSESLRDIVTAIVGADKTPHDDYLHACNVCGCSLKAKIWLPLSVLQSHLSKEVQVAFPSWCWILNESRPR